MKIISFDVISGIKDVNIFNILQFNLNIKYYFYWLYYLGYLVVIV